MVKTNPGFIRKQHLKLSALILLFLCSISVNGQQLLEQTILMDTLEREYLLYIPADYDGSEAWPLVLNMHGAGNTKEEQLFISQMNQVADTAHFLIAYPEAALGPGPLGNLAPVWNVGLNPNRPNDVTFLDQLIQTVGQNWNLDLARVYTTGMSQGGSMSYVLTCNLSSRIAAMASVSGSPGLATNWMCTPNRPVPLMHIHGTADLITPINGGPGVLGPIPAFPPARTLLDSWINSNNCTVDSTTTALPDLTIMDSSTVTLTQFQNCDTYTSADGVERTTEIWFYQIDNGGHTWPDGPAEQVPPQFAQFFGNINRDINASSEIWNFFNRHLHPNPAPIPQLLEKTITVDGIEREYLLYIPASYNGDEAWPLVLNLHGYLWNPKTHIDISGMNAVADTAHFLVAYPAGEIISLSGIEGIAPFIPPTGPGWNIGGDVSENDEITFIIRLMDEVILEYEIDETRIYSTGFSMGGIVSYMLACALPDRIAAIASVSGNLLPEDGPIDFPCSSSSSVPVLQIHGTNDLIDPYQESQVFQGVDKSIAFWLNQNDCPVDSVMSVFPNIDMTDQSTVTSIQYLDCKDSTEVWLYRIEGGGHWWPGGAPIPPAFAALGPANRDINASSEIWNFFNRHALSEGPSNINYLNATKIGLKVFPNPFTTKLAFEFELLETANVQLSLFNTLGQPVAHIINQQMAVGMHRLDWQTQEHQLVPGLYYFRLHIDDRWLSQSVILGSGQ